MSPAQRCRYFGMTILGDIELGPAFDRIPASLAVRLLPWLWLVCAAILLAAAVLHWRRTRHRCLLALAAASLLGVLGTAAGLVFRMHPAVEQLPSGAIRIDTSLATAGEWLMISGLIIGAVGGIAAIHWALMLRRRT